MRASSNSSIWWSSISSSRPTDRSRRATFVRASFECVSCAHRVACCCCRTGVRASPRAESHVAAGCVGARAPGTGAFRSRRILRAQRGFLIAHRFHDVAGSDVLRYLARRAWRIVPVYWLITALTLAWLMLQGEARANLSPLASREGHVDARVVPGLVVRRNRAGMVADTRGALQCGASHLLELIDGILCHARRFLADPQVRRRTLHALWSPRIRIAAAQQQRKLGGALKRTGSRVDPSPRVCPSPRARLSLLHRPAP